MTPWKSCYGCRFMHEVHSGEQYCDLKNTLCEKVRRECDEFDRVVVERCSGCEYHRQSFIEHDFLCENIDSTSFGKHSELACQLFKPCTKWPGNKFKLEISNAKLRLCFGRMTLSEIKFKKALTETDTYLNFIECGDGDGSNLEVELTANNNMASYFYFPCNEVILYGNELPDRCSGCMDSEMSFDPLPDIDGTPRYRVRYTEPREEEEDE